VTQGTDTEGVVAGDTPALPAIVEQDIRKAERTDRIVGTIQRQGALAVLAVVVIVASVSFPNFRSFDNAGTILIAAAPPMLIALGMTFVIITGGIDLSIGTGMALCAVISGELIVNAGLPVPLGVLGTILFGGLLGLINGFNIAILKIPPFIATLAMMLVAQGLALVISHSTPIYFSDAPSYIKISTGHLIPALNLPNAVLVFAFLAVVSAVLLNKTILGRYTYSIGSNEEATALSGINTRKWKMVVYALAGLFIGMAGVLISARLGSAQPATGAGYELQAIAAVVIGGTSLAGGKGSIVGTVIGALIISVLNNGLQLMSIPQEWQNVILGCVILVAVYADMARKRAA
jgi:ribose transport system permease protein